MLLHLWASVKSAEFLARSQICHLKCVKCSSDSKYTTYKPIQVILKKLQPFEDIKVRNPDLCGYEHEMVKGIIKICPEGMSSFDILILNIDPVLLRYFTKWTVFWGLEPNLFENKKVLLRERKRHTAHCVTSARYADLFPEGWGGGFTPSSPWWGGGGTPHLIMILDLIPIFYQI